MGGISREECVTRWETRRIEWAKLGVRVEGAIICDEVLADLQEVFRTEDEAQLTLDEAAAMSGYSSDHIRRLARDGRLQVTRRGNRLFFRRGDLPRKPIKIDATLRLEYDAHADARRVALRRNGGRN